MFNLEESFVRSYLISYGKNMRKLRKKAGFSQLDVAGILLCSQAIISHIECGYMLPPPHIHSGLIELYSGGGLHEYQTQRFTSSCR